MGDGEAGIIVATAAHVDEAAVSHAGLREEVTRSASYSASSAYDLGNLLRRLVLPLAIQSWTLTSLQQRRFKTGGRLIRQAESPLTPTLFRQILGRIERPAWSPT